MLMQIRDSILHAKTARKDLLAMEEGILQQEQDLCGR